MNGKFDYVYYFNYSDYLFCFALDTEYSRDVSIENRHALLLDSIFFLFQFMKSSYELLL